MFCPECGKQINDTSKFCINCGHRIESDIKKETKTETQGQKGKDIHQEVLITEEEVLDGVERKVSVRKDNKEIDEVTIKIPPGTISGVVLKIPGKGNSGLNGGTNGDLYLKIIRCKEKIKEDLNTYTKPDNTFKFPPKTETVQKKPEGLLSILQDSLLIFGIILVLCVVVLILIFSSGGSKSDNPKSSDETVVQTSPPDPLQVLSEQPPSDMRPDSELYNIYKLGSDYTDVQRENVINEIKGSIVLWTLPVYEVYKKKYGYDITTSSSEKNDIFGSTKYVSTEIHLYPRSSSDREFVESLKTGDTIQIKGVIKGLTWGRSIIIDPCILPNKFDQTKIPVSKEKMGQVETVELKDVSDSDDTVKTILKNDKSLVKGYLHGFSVSMFDVNNDGLEDILYTYSGNSGSCGVTWSILINKKGGGYTRSKFEIPCVGHTLDFSNKTYKGMRIPYNKNVEIKYGMLP